MARADLVFEGGGVKGIGLAGAYRELRERGYEPACVAGTSAGAITAALVAVGYSGPELEDVVLEQMHFTEFADHGRFGFLGEVGEAVVTRGLHSGRYFLGWMRECLEHKRITHFGQLRDKSATQESRRYRLQVVASDLSTRSMLVLPRDADQLGLDPDELEIAEAVRMSMSIPVFFEPVTLKDPRTGASHVIVDGGILSNFPVWLFDCQGRSPEFPTFGMLLVAPGQSAPLIPASAGGEAAAPIASDLDFVKAMAETMMEAHDRLYLDQASFARTIPIPTLGVRTTEFAIPHERARALFDSGRHAAARFLESWDFDTYVQRYRRDAVARSRPV
ncbi:MAG TPA: patatin-like phospholipase family protein [Solirubrobacteraceae bacterium]|nr:patatin-like phospholipase family protein [Solirubrobacteraceae bacterium]